MERQLTELREIAKQSSHDEQIILNSHLFYFVFKDDHPDKEPLDILIPDIHNRIRNSPGPTKVKYAFQLYALLQFHKDTIQKLRDHKQEQPLTSSTPLESQQTPPPPAPSPIDSLPDLEPFSPNPSPTPTTVNPQDIFSPPLATSTPFTFTTTNYSDDTLVNASTDSDSSSSSSSSSTDYDDVADSDPRFSFTSIFPLFLQKSHLDQTDPI